jgi:hypothetical protein
MRSRAGAAEGASDRDHDAGTMSLDAAIEARDAGAPSHCTQTVAMVCSPFDVAGKMVDFSNCPPTWNDAIAFCIRNAGDYGFAETDCGTYRRFRIENIDVGCSYYYDKDGHDLVAVFCDDGCLAGPPGFIEPACPPLQPLDYRPCTASDVLGDAGAGTASGQ